MKYVGIGCYMFSTRVESPLLSPTQHIVRMVSNYFDRQPRKPSLIVHNLPENLNDEELVKDIIEKEH